MSERIIKFKNSIYTVDALDEAGQSVVAEIFKHREYRQAETAIIEAKANECILDIGAHLGFFALYTRSLNPQAQIICLEPNKKNFEILKNNLKKNKIQNIVLLNMGLAADSGERQFSVSSDSHNSRMISVKNENIKHCVCKTISFSDLVAECNIKIISLLKMDIEGAEFEIIENMNKDDFALIKNIIFEYHNSVKNNHKKLEKILRERGFSVQIFPSKFDKKLGFIFAQNKK